MLSEYCIYTIRHSNNLKSAVAKGGMGEYEEEKPWAQGKRLLEEARQQHRRLAVIFAPAEKTDPLYGWALLDEIVIDGDHTKYSFSALRRFKRPEHKSGLRKKADGKPISLDSFDLTPSAALRRS